MEGRLRGRCPRLRFLGFLICAHAWVVLPAGLEAANCERNPTHHSCTGDGDPPPQGDVSYVLYLDRYVSGDFYLARLPDLVPDNPDPVNPEIVTLKKFKGKLGNPDVSADGRTIVFGALVRNDWNIYTGDLDVVTREVTNINPLADRRGVREEDPRYSWDGQQVVYKCDGDICLFPEIAPNPVVSSGCELWGPSFHPAGTRVSYTARCGADQTDRIFIYDWGTGQTTAVPNLDGGPDRFSHFLGDGRLVYSHLDPQDGTASLWSYAGGNSSLLHDRTISDDDSYADKRDWEYLAFIGYQGGYNLFIYRGSRMDSVQLTQDRPVLGPVVFHVEHSP
jgi:hypothetical protein